MHGHMNVKLVLGVCVSVLVHILDTSQQLERSLFAL